MELRVEVRQQRAVMAEDLPGFTVCSLPRRLMLEDGVTKRRFETRVQHDASVLVVQLH